MHQQTSVVQVTANHLLTTVPLHSDMSINTCTDFGSANPIYRQTRCEIRSWQARCLRCEARMQLTLQTLPLSIKYMKGGTRMTASKWWSNQRVDACCAMHLGKCNSSHTCLSTAVRIHLAIELCHLLSKPCLALRDAIAHVFRLQ